MGELKYFAAFTLPVVTFMALWWPEQFCWATVIYAFGIIPFAELIIPPQRKNVTPDSERQLSSNRIYDLMLYAMVPAQYALLGLLIYRAAWDELPQSQLIGMTVSMGIHCGGVGINVAHELGHRITKLERLLAHLLLLSALYMHFTIEHNRGHHKHVATPGDPATARRNESLYRFWLRCIPSMFASAWRIERAELNKRNLPSWSWHNAMLRLMVIELSVVIAIGILAGAKALLCFLSAAFIGILVLETVNYIEHYGLMRKELSPGKFERVQPWHSWNSDFLLGRIMLFELTRHADHHYSASRRYQILRHLPEGPQLPVGYPAAMLMAMLPPIWFHVVHRTLDAETKDTSNNTDHAAKPENAHNPSAAD